MTCCASPDRGSEDGRPPRQRQRPRRPAPAEDSERAGPGKRSAAALKRRPTARRDRKRPRNEEHRSPAGRGVNRDRLNGSAGPERSACRRNAPRYCALLPRRSGQVRSRFRTERSRVLGLRVQQNGRAGHRGLRYHTEASDEVRSLAEMRLEDAIAASPSAEPRAGGKRPKKLEARAASGSALNDKSEKVLGPTAISRRPTSAPTPSDAG